MKSACYLHLEFRNDVAVKSGQPTCAVRAFTVHTFVDRFIRGADTGKIDIARIYSDDELDGWYKIYHLKSYYKEGRFYW